MGHLLNNLCFLSHDGTETVNGQDHPSLGKELNFIPKDVEHDCQSCPQVYLDRLKPFRITAGCGVKDHEYR